MQDLSNHIMDETISPSSNVDMSTTSNTRNRPTSRNSGHCLECHTGSHSENREKATPSKPLGKSSRQNMLRNVNHFNRHVRKHRKRSFYTRVMRALLGSRDINPAHKEFFNSLISDLKKKNKCWDRTSDLLCEGKWLKRI